MPEWIPYETDDRPVLEVSIDVDLDGDTALRAARPYVVSVTITGFTPGADGQPDDTAAEKLFGLEQRAESVCTENGATPAFTVSGDSRYQFFAYAPTGDLEGPLRDALSGSGFTVEVKAKRDDKWTTYEEYALRGDDLEGARDCDLIEQMEESGEDLSQEYIVTFEWSVQNERAYDTAVQALRGAGYDVMQQLEADVIPVETQMLITPESLHDERAAMAKVLAPYQPTFEGWEADALEDVEDLEPVE